MLDRVGLDGPWPVVGLSVLGTALVPVAEISAGDTDRMVVSRIVSQVSLVSLPDGVALVPSVLTVKLAMRSWASSAPATSVAAACSWATRLARSAKAAGSVSAVSWAIAASSSHFWTSPPRRSAWLKARRRST